MSMRRININTYFKIIFSILVFAFFILVSANNLKAADATVGVSSTESAEKGDGVSVSVSVSGDSISAYTVFVSYDPSVLSFNSGSGAIVNGGNGSITISGTGAASVELSFTAVGEGGSGIYSSGEFYDIEMNELEVSYGSSYVEVSDEKTEDTTEATEEKTEDTTETTEERTEDTNEKTTESTERDDKSSNCNLYTLEVSEGTLTPEFNTSTTYYEMTVAKDVKYIEVSAYPSDSKASVSVTDNDNIEPGENHMYITVTAENGDTRLYTIRVIAGELEKDSMVTVDKKKYSIVKNLSDIYGYADVPDGYEETTVIYDNSDIPVLSYNDGKVYIAFLKDGQENISPFVFDNESGKFYRYVLYYMNNNRYLITDIKFRVLNCI